MSCPHAARTILALLTLSFACASAKPPHRFDGPAPTNAEDRALARFAERYLDVTLKMDPVRASYLGYSRYDARLPDWSASGLKSGLGTLTGLQNELNQINKSKLSRGFSVDYELIRGALAEQRFVYQDLQPFSWDLQMYNEQVGGGLYYLTIPPEDPKQWPARLSAIVARTQALPRLLKNAQAQLKTPAQVFTDFMVAQNPGNLKTLQETLPPLFEGHPTLKRRFEAVLPKAVQAVKDYQVFLEGPLAQASTGDWRLKEARFSQKLAHTLGTDLSPKAVLKGAEHGLAKARFQMYDVALPLFKTAFPADRHYLTLLGDPRINYVVGKVIAEASKQHGTPDTMFADVNKKAETIKAWLKSSDFIELPPATDHFVIEPTPPFLDGLAVAFYNPAPAFSPDLKKSFWISTVPTKTPEDTESYLQEYNSYILDALTIHEAFPGHYVQLYWSSHAPGASVIKRVLESGTMAEGWAMMVEQLMHEAGWGSDDPRQLLFHLKMRLRIFINAIIDVRLHTSTDENPDALDAWALDLMMTQGFQEQAEATRKLRRAKLSSTQLSTYYVGYREMLEIYRDLDKGSLSSKAALMKMMSYGTIAPKVIRQLLKQDGLL